MSLLNKAKMQRAFDAVSVVWNNALKSVTATWTEWAGSVQSETETEYYNWAELLVQIREWIGDRVIGNVKGEEWAVKNRPFEGTFSLKIDDINNDRLGMLKTKTEDLLAAAKFHPENLLMDAVELAFTANCFDGQIFFDTDHPTLVGDGTTFSNLSTDPFSYDALLAADKHRFTLKNAQGNRLQLEPESILIGSKYIHKAEEIYAAEKKPGSLSDVNQLKGKYKPVLCSKFEGAKEEYWAVTYKIPASSLRAFLYQGRTEPEIYTSAIEGSSNFGLPSKDPISFMKNEVYFGTDFQGAATFTLPVLARASTGTGA